MDELTVDNFSEITIDLFNIDEGENDNGNSNGDLDKGNSINIPIYHHNNRDTGIQNMETIKNNQAAGDAESQLRGDSGSSARKDFSVGEEIKF